MTATGLFLLALDTLPVGSRSAGCDEAHTDGMSYRKAAKPRQTFHHLDAWTAHN